jgi:hypothetical protein
MKNRLFDILFILYLGFLYIYIFNKPPTIIIKYPNINQLL